MTNGLRFIDPLPPAARPVAIRPLVHDPIVVPAPARSPRKFSEGLDTVLTVLYCGFWLLVAVYSAATSVQENDAPYLLLTSTASLNIFLYKLTGKTRGELNKTFIKRVKRTFPYLLCGAIAAGASSA